MSTTCKLCARQLVDGDIEQVAGHESRVELLEYIFAKYDLQYDSKDILCVACQKNLKAVKLVMSRWEEAQKKQRAATVRTTPSMTTTTTTKKATPPTVKSSKQETLLKKPETVIKTVIKLPVQTNKNSTDNSKEEDNCQTKLTTNQKKDRSTATTKLKLSSTSPTKVKNKGEPKTKLKDADNEDQLLQELLSADDDVTNAVNTLEKVPLTRSVLKRQQKQVEAEKKESIEQKPVRKIHNIKFKKELKEENKEEEEEEDAAQPPPRRKKPKYDTSNDSIQEENLDQVEEEEDKINENENILLETVEPVDVSEVGSMIEIALIRNANGETIAHIFEENKCTVKENDSAQTCIICELCQAVITNIRDFNKHLKTHSQYKYMNQVSTEDDRKMIFYECVSCEKVFLELYNVSRHHRDVHRAPTDRYKCSQCGSSFKYKISLTEHLAKHMKINLNIIKCDYCDSTFKNNYQLNRHMRIHTGERPYECETCHKTFRHSANLTVHIRTHTGELPFVCTLCNKGFSTSTHMRRHFKSCEKRYHKLKNQSPTMVTIKDEDLRFEPQKSTNSEVVYTLNTEQIINNNQNDSLLKRSVTSVESNKRKPVQITKTTSLSPAKKQLNQSQMQLQLPKKLKLQPPQRKEQVQVVKVQIVPNVEKKAPATRLMKCKVCNKIFKGAEALKVHMSTHSLPPLRCNLCSKSFSERSLFKRHLHEHMKTASTCLQKAATTKAADEDDSDGNADEEEEELEDIQEIEDDDESILIDYQIDKLEPESPTSSQNQSHDDGVDTSTLNNFRIISLNDM